MVSSLYVCSFRGESSEVIVGAFISSMNMYVGFFLYQLITRLYKSIYLYYVLTKRLFYEVAGMASTLIMS